MSNMKNKDSWAKYMIIAAIVVIAVMVTTYLVITACFGKMDERGQFGDMFGMVNALFSGLAFAGVIITIRQQHIDLEYQRETIKQTNDEMERQTKEFELQNKTLKKQQFDNTYFELLRMLQTIVDGLSLDVQYLEDGILQRITLTGRAVFQELFKPRKGKVLGDSSCYTYTLHKEIDENGVNEVLSKNEYKFLYHYFRFVYRILKFIDETPLLTTTEERYENVLFLRSTLSNYETAALFYNCLTDVGRAKFKHLAERYALFDNIDKKLIAPSIGLSAFQDSAYSFYRGLVVEKAQLRMRAVTDGEYQWQLDIDLIAKNDNINIGAIELLNTQAFWREDGKELNRLYLLKILVDKDIDISSLNKDAFNKKAKDLFLSQCVDTHKLYLKENDKVHVTCADITYSIREMDGYDFMPSTGWSLKITEKDGPAVTVRLKMEILGDKREFS